VRELHKEWTEVGVTASRRATTHAWVLDTGFNVVFLVKPLLNNKRQKHLIWAKKENNWSVAQQSRVLFSDESTFCISFGN